MSLNVGIVGATGVVGQVFMSLLQERNFPVNELRLFASEASFGKKIKFQNRDIACSVLKDKCFDGLDLVFFSSGDDISLKWAPHAVECGAFAIDNSAAFRMSDEHTLIVPEINGHLLPTKDNNPAIIANPNCSTIQLVVALAPLAKDFGIHSVQVATYQSVSGAGKDGITELKSQTDQLNNDPLAKVEAKVFSQQIAYNSIPQIGSFDEDGFCSEEIKIMNETRKILNMPELNVSAFTVRVPSLNGHSEAVWVELDEAASKEQVAGSLANFSGITYVEQSTPESYPTVVSTNEKYDVFVGRLHKNPASENGWMMWVVADNLRKGAALNGLQIAEKIFQL